MGGAFSANEMRNVFKALVGKTRHRWEDKFGMDHIQTG
jgi:hypothetical protein